MNMKKWTPVLLGAGLISLPAAMQAEEAVEASPILTALSSTTLSGYIDTSAVWKFGTGNANMPGRTYDGPDVQDGFNMNVASLTLEKPLDESDWAAGYHMQLLLGPGARKRGTGSLIGGGTLGTPAGDFAFNEAYVALRAPVGNGIDFKVGQFGTYNGFEAYDTYKNPNWSRSYGFFIESSAHTGISASYRVNDVLSLMAGVGNSAGYNNMVDAKQAYESKKAYLGMVSLTAPETFGFLSGATLSVGYTVGDAQRDVTGTASTGNPAGGTRFNQGNFYVGGVIPTPVAGLTLGAAFDYTHGQAREGDVATATALYVMYEIEKWKFANRFDYARSSSGLFDGLDHGKSDKLFAYTLTVDYSLWANVISRAEFRWDTSLTGDRPYGGTVAGMPSDKNAVSLAFNLIYQF
jgi:hypothetical protein